MINELRFKVTGVVPLVMHNGQTADPMNEWSKMIKKITSKRDKTDADYEELMHLEWFASLYITDEKRPCLTGEQVEGALFNAAKKTKQGKLLKSCVYSEGNFPLVYDGPADLEELFKNQAYRLTCSVVVSGRRVVRTRAKFDKWSATVSIWSDNEQVNDDGIERIMKTAGMSCGYADWRPRFGRFTVERVAA